MSIAVMSRVWQDADADGTMLLLLLALADYSNDAGLSWPSVATLARKIRLKRRQTFTLLREAEKLGLLVCDSGGKKGEPKRSNRYRLTLPTRAADRTGALDRTDAPGDTTTGAVQRTLPVRPTAPKPSRNHQKNRHSFSAPLRVAVKTDYDSVIDNRDTTS